MARPKIDEELVRQLVKLLDESGLTELDYSIGKLRVRVSRAAGKAAPAVAVETSEQAAAPGSLDADAISSHPGAVNHVSETKPEKCSADVIDSTETAHPNSQECANKSGSRLIQ